MSIHAKEASVLSQVRASSASIARSSGVIVLQRRHNSNKPAGTSPTPKIQNRHANKPLHAPRDHLRATHQKPNPAGNEGSNRPNYNNYNNNNNANNDSNAPRQFRPRDGQNNRPFNNRPYKEGQGRPPRQFTNGDNKQTFANSNRTGAQEGDGNKKFRRTEPARVEGVKPPTILRTSRDRATIPSSKRAPESELLPEDYEAYEAELESLHRADMEQFEEEQRPEPTLPEEEIDPRAVQQLEDQELFINDNSEPDLRRNKKFVEKKKSDKYKLARTGKKQRGEKEGAGPVPVGAAKKRKREHEEDEEDEGTTGTFKFPGARNTNLISTQSRYLDTAVFDAQAEQLATSQKLQGFAADYAAQGEIDASMRMATTDMRRNVSANFEREMQRERSQRLQELKQQKAREKWLTKRRADITASRAQQKSRAKERRAKTKSTVQSIKQQAGAAYYAELGYWFTREELLVPQVRAAVSAVVRNPTLSKQQRLDLVLNVQQMLESVKKMPNETKRLYREVLLPENLNRVKPTDVRLIEHNMVIPIYDWHQMIALAESEMTPEEKAKRYAPPPSDK
jgi:hypothetical protein